MSRSILLADDSATLRKVVELTFSDSGFHVESVGSGQEAMERLRAFVPDFVLADVVMPAPTGYEICRHVKNADRRVPVLLLAGAFESFDVDLARECGADGFLLKPFESRILIERVEDLLARYEGDALDRAEEIADESGAEAEFFPTDDAMETAPVPEPRPVDTHAGTGIEFSSETIERLADAVARRLSVELVKEVVRDTVPRIVEEVVRQRLRDDGHEDS